VPDIEAAIAAYAHETISEVVDRLRAPGRSVEGQVLHGRPASAIVDNARDFSADLVIVGSRGHSTVAWPFLGSTSMEVVSRASCPVLVARRATLSRIVFATDGGHSAQEAEAILSRWPIFAGLPVRVVSVPDAVPWTTAVVPAMYGQVLDAYASELLEPTAEHQRIADETAARLRARGLVADVEIRGGGAAREIVAAAEERDTDLIVVGTGGRAAGTRLLLGSVAENVLSNSPASVLIVRPH
jgi:nucleotide-binding universal stress UspA family protein